MLRFIWFISVTLKIPSVTRLFSGLFGPTVNTVVPKQFSLAMLILFASVPKAKLLDLSVATQNGSELLWQKNGTKCSLLNQDKIITVNICNWHNNILTNSSSNVYLSFFSWVIVSGTGHFKGFASLWFSIVW